MNSIINYPEPSGFETINDNGTEVTLDELLIKKKKISQLISDSLKHTEQTIDNNNFIYYAIVYERTFYSDLEQPTNILELFEKIYDILNSVSNRVKLASDKFTNLLHISKSELIQINQSNDTSLQCPICTDIYCEHAKITMLPCKHHYDQECIKKWLIEQSNKCPICRSEVK